VEKHFGEQNSLGKTIRMNEADYTVTGIIRSNFNSHLQFNAILSLQTKSNSDTIANCGEKNVYTYILTHENADIEQLTSKMPGFYDKYLNLEEGERIRFCLPTPERRITGEPFL
jgi:hypothetical protein